MSATERALTESVLSRLVSEAGCKPQIFVSESGLERFAHEHFGFYNGGLVYFHGAPVRPIRSGEYVVASDARVVRMRNDFSLPVQDA